MRRNLTQLGSSDNKSCACSRDLFDLDSINNRSFRCNAHSPDIADDCWDTTVAPTTVAPTTVAKTTVAATTTQERRTSGGVVGTSDRPLTTRGRGTTSPERDKTSHGEKSTKFTHEASTKEADYTSRDPGPISHPELDRSTLDSVGQYETSGTTGAVVPPSPVAVVKKGQTYIYYIIAAAAVVLLAMVAGALYCRYVHHKTNNIYIFTSILSVQLLAFLCFHTPVSCINTNILDTPYLIHKITCIFFTGNFRCNHGNTSVTMVTMTRTNTVLKILGPFLVGFIPANT